MQSEEQMRVFVTLQRLAGVSSNWKLIRREDRPVWFGRFTERTHCTAYFCIF